MAEFYNLEEASRVLGMSSDELKLKAQHREVRAFLDGGTWRFRKPDIEELARRRGMGSDPDLSLSDLDLEVPGGSGSDDIDLSEFQLGVAKAESGTRPAHGGGATDDDVLLDDMSLAGEAGASSSSTIIGMKPAGKQPSDSDVTLVPENRGSKQPSDSDVRLGSAPPRAKFPSDSDVTLVNDSQGSSDEVAQVEDPGATTLRKSPIGSSAEVDLGTDSDDSDFELTPSSVIDALQPESGSDFELTALDASDEFEATPERSPSDSDVTGVEPASSGINLGRPSDSGINLSGVGTFDFSSAESIELAPLDEDAPSSDPRYKKPPAAPKPSAKRPDPSETALPVKGSALDPSATALPIKKKGEKDIFEDTDFEVDALDSGNEDRTVQLEAASDFDIDEGESGSEVFALDEDEIDENAATAMGPADLAGDDEFEDGGDGTSGETESAWGDVESDAQMPTPAATSTRASAAPAITARGAEPEWGGAWVSVLGIATFLLMLMAFVSMDLVANLYENRGSATPIGYGLVKWLSGMAPWG
jgi:hypothetical protein